MLGVLGLLAIKLLVNVLSHLLPQLKLFILIFFLLGIFIAKLDPAHTLGHSEDVNSALIR